MKYYKGPARIYPWRKMHRSRAPSIAPGTFFVAQPWADCITNMPGFNLRQAQRAKIRNAHYSNDRSWRQKRTKAKGRLQRLPGAKGAARRILPDDPSRGAGPIFPMTKTQPKACVLLPL
jgi:hypothetical protein